MKKKLLPNDDFWGWYNWLAERIIIQFIGRGRRNIEDYTFVLLCGSRFKHLRKHYGFINEPNKYLTDKLRGFFKHKGEVLRLDGSGPDWPYIEIPENIRKN